MLPSSDLFYARVRPQLGVGWGGCPKSSEYFDFGFLSLPMRDGLRGQHHLTSPFGPLPHPL